LSLLIETVIFGFLSLSPFFKIPINVENDRKF
jgi:hypothetical protein